MDESVPSLLAPQSFPAPPSPPQAAPPAPTAASTFAPPPPALPQQTADHAPPSPFAPQYAVPTTPAFGTAPTSTATGPDLSFHPAPAPKKTRGILIGGLAALAAVSVAGGAFIITQDSSSDAIVDDNVRIVTDPDVSPEAYSFAAAASNAQQSASVSFDMSMETPEGPMTMIAAFDRASARMSFEVDLSQLDADEYGLDMGESMRMIMDEKNQVAYIGGDFYGSFFGVETEWISTELSEVNGDSDTLDQLFTNPQNMTEVFGDLEPIDLGPDTIDGEALHHYQITLDAAAIAAEADSGNLLDGLESADGVVFDVWVSEDSQIRRIVLDVDDADEPGTLDMWIISSPDPIDIALPDPADVVSFDELFSEWNDEFEFDVELEQEMPIDPETVQD